MAHGPAAAAAAAAAGWWCCCYAFFFCSFGWASFGASESQFTHIGKVQTVARVETPRRCRAFAMRMCILYRFNSFIYISIYLYNIFSFFSFFGFGVEYFVSFRFSMR